MSDNQVRMHILFFIMDYLINKVVLLHMNKHVTGCKIGKEGSQFFSLKILSYFLPCIFSIQLFARISLAMILLISFGT